MSKKRIRAERTTLLNWGGADREVIVLPATAAAYEQMVEQGALAMYDSAKLLHRLNMAPIVNDPDYWRTLSRNHMAAQGITPPKKGQP